MVWIAHHKTQQKNYMEITYKNRKDDTYYLHEGKTKIGNPKYFFSKKIKGILPDRIPDGYEIYENIDAQVFLRKIQPKIITDEEVNTVKSHLEKCTHIPHWQVEVKKNTIIVYTSDDNEKSIVNECSNVFGGLFSPIKKDLLERALKRNIHYMPMLKFTLVDKTNRTFDLDRQYFRGEGGWMKIDYEKSLNELAKKYSPYLNTEKFFELY